MGLSKENQFIIFWSIIGAIAFLVIWYLPWRFQVNDDVIMMWLVSGAYTGTPETYAVFIHPILSWTLAKFYTFFPEVDWYGGTWFWVIGLSFFLFVKNISAWDRTAWLKNGIALFFLLMTIHFSFFPQFTIVSGFAAFSALSGLFSKENEGNSSQQFISILLFFIASLIRWESVALVGLGFGVFQVSVGRLSFFRQHSMKLLVALLLFSSIVGSKFFWEGNSEYAEFLQFNKVRSSVIDHPVFRQEIIENHIIPETEFYFFSRWYFESDFPTEIQLTEKNKQLNQELLTVKQFKNSLQRLWDFQKMEAFKSFLILVMMLNFLASTKNHLGLMRFFLIWILFFVIFNHFFLLQGRVVVLFFMCFLIPLFSGFRPNFSPLIMKSTIVIFLFLLSFHSYNFLKEANGRLIMDQEFSYLNSLVNDTSPIIMEGFQEHNSEIKYSSLNQVPFLTTGWISRSPFQQKALSRFGLKSFEDIREYVLITPATNLEIVFPSYMDSIVGEFKLLDSSHTNNFVFLHFKK